MKPLPDDCVLDLRDFVTWHLDQFREFNARATGPTRDQPLFSELFVDCLDQLCAGGLYEWAYQFLMVYLIQGAEEMFPGSVYDLSERFQGIPGADAAVVNYLVNQPNPEAN